MDKKTEENRLAICINNTNNELSLELRKVYQVVEDELAEKRNYLRIIDETGEDYLFPKENFVIVSLPAKSAESVLALA